MEDKTKIVKTVLKVTILSEGNIGTEDLSVVAREIVVGDWSGNVEELETKLLTKAEVIEECEKQATDPVFFLGDEDE